MQAEDLSAGPVSIHVLPDEQAAGRAAFDAAIAAAFNARRHGRRVVMWLMAAPSAFKFYEAFVKRAETEPEVAAIARDAEYFQFDDYPISRESDRFPVTFRHLLEQRFAAPLRAAAGGLGSFRFLELTGVL